MKKLFGDDCESEIVRLIIEGKTNTQIKREVGFRRSSGNVEPYRRALLNGDERITKLADAHAKKALESLGSLTNALGDRAATMPPEAIVQVIGLLLQQLRRAGVRFEVPADSPGSTD